MSLLANIIGFSMFGLAARIGQLGIQRRNLLDNPGGHIISMVVFGTAGYWAYQWDLRAGELLEIKRNEIQERRRRQRDRAVAAAAAASAPGE